MLSLDFIADVEMGHRKMPLCRDDFASAQNCTAPYSHKYLGIPLISFMKLGSIDSHQLGSRNASFNPKREQS